MKTSLPLALSLSRSRQTQADKPKAGHGWEQGDGDGLRGAEKCTRDRQEHLDETVKNALVRLNEKTYFPFDVVPQRAREKERAREWVRERERPARCRARFLMEILLTVS